MQRYPRGECSPEQNGERCGYDQMGGLEMEGGINKKILGDKICYDNGFKNIVQWCCRRCSETLTSVFFT